MYVDFMLIGRRVKEIRKQLRVTQAQLAEMTDLSISYISHIETAQKKASLDSLVRIADALGIEFSAYASVLGKVRQCPSVQI